MLDVTCVMLQVDQGDLLELLGKAVTCAVLGKAGPQRSRVLAVLYKVCSHERVYVHMHMGVCIRCVCASVCNMYCLYSFDPKSMIFWQDERLASLEQLPQFASHPAILAKMHTEQLLLGDEMSTFEASLMPHQRAVSSLRLKMTQHARARHKPIPICLLHVISTFITTTISGEGAT